MHLARRLVHEGASVTVIETDPKLVQEATETMDARVLKGNSMSLSSWRAAEAESMELMIAATNDDATSIGYTDSRAWLMQERLLAVEILHQSET